MLEDVCEHLRALGFADARRPLDEKWLAERKRQLECGGERLVHDEPALVEATADVRRLDHGWATNGCGFCRKRDRQLAQQK